MDRRKFMAMIGAAGATTVLPGITLVKGKDEDLGLDVDIETQEARATITMRTQGLKHTGNNQYGLGFKVAPELLDDDLHWRRMEGQLIEATRITLSKMMEDLL